MKSLPKYHLLIIDDDPTRKPLYETLFSGDDQPFCLNFIDTAEELGNINNIQADAFLIDMFLQSWNMKASDVITKISNELPIILVSDKWFDKDRKSIDLLNYTVDSPICYFVILNDLFDEDNKKAEGFDERVEQIRFRVRTELNKFHRVSNFNPIENETINIIQISDTQFGDPNTDNEAFLAEVQIPKQLRKVDIIPHFLLITGDISFSGLPNEYEKALIWFKGLQDEMWPGSDMTERILLVPGNHDINLKLQAADHYNFDTIKKNYIKNKETNKPHISYGMSPFKRFAYRLTNDTKWFTNEDDLCWINERFRHAGIRFIQMNSVNYLTSENLKSSEFPDDAMTKIVKDLTDDNFFNIVYSHHGASKSTPTDDKGSTKTKFSGFLDNIETDLFVHGHGHAFRAIHDQNLITVMAPSSHVNGALRPIGERRGFNIIQLHRSNGLVTQIGIKAFEWDGTFLTERRGVAAKYNTRYFDQ